MTPYFDLAVLWYPNYYLVSQFFMHSKYKKDHTHLLVFNTTVLLNLSYLKFANKSKILPFRNFDCLTKIIPTLDGGVYLERLNEYLIFLLLFYLSKNEIKHTISDLWFKKLRKNSLKMNTKWFYITIVAYRCYSPVF